jgi:hypothetical protein
MPELKVDWSSEELKILLSQALALEFIKLQRKEEKSKKIGWSVILQSTVVATLMTVVLGGVGTYLADRIQANNARMTAEQKAVDAAITSIAKIAAASQDMIDLADETWNENANGLSSEIQRTIRLRKRGVLVAYSSALGEWRIDRERLGYTLMANYKHPEDVQIKWSGLTKTADDFADCAVTFAAQYEAASERPLSVRNACARQRDAFRTAILELTKLVVASKTFSDKAQ